MEVLGAFVNQARWEDIEPSAVRAAKYTLLDSLAAQLFGNREEEVQRLAQMASSISPGVYRILGTEWTAGLYEAAFINGCGSVATEMDEGNQWSKGHPAAHVIPTLLTYAQSMDACTGQHFLLSLITGYEACSRFGRAVTLHPDAHAHGTWGVMGAASAILLLAGAEEEEWVEGVKLSASFAMPTMWNAALEGALIRNVYAGQASESGIRSLQLVRSGYLAPTQSLDYIFGSVLGSAFDREAMLAGMGEGWEIERNYFKPYAFCRYAHAPLDAFASLLAEHSLNQEEIEQVEVRTYSRAATLSNQAPHNVLAAKFSIPYALAVRLWSGIADHTVFADRWLGNEEVRAFARKVTVRNDSELEKEYPSIMPAVVTITCTDGRVYEARCDIAEGGPGKAFTPEALIAKFRALTAGILSPARQDELIAFVENMEQEVDITPLFALCVPDAL
ncbi:MmgE/PrpD family protein [Aneurinibacillus sp. REN35]|uniref:MmgE/PrpD family protein n=1 Tax=Aneurinibacillus sp. REN35 TaxID=3237286 RepID=UPI0035285B28